MKTIGKKSALLAIIESMNYETKRDDEFTANEFLNEARNAGKSMTLSAVRSHLQRMSQEGKLDVRKITIDGKITNCYSAK
jgi:Fe2+ or Zn2+ uptake regulation protein